MSGTFYESEQVGVRCSIVRGGSSKGIFFLEHDLPPAGPERDLLLKRVMGTPDIRQIDGLGGANLLTSKIAIVGRSTLPGADIAYTFAQVEVERDVIDYSGNCGNISAGVGPFAIDAGLVAATEPVTEVRIHNTNTDKVIIAHVPVSRGRARVAGSLAISGVPGTGVDIVMDYRLSLGAKTGRVLPTGHRRELLLLENGRRIEVTICDVANPAVFVRARDVGLRGDELPQHVDHDAATIALLREIRGKAAERIGLASAWDRVDEESALLPFVVFVSPPTSYRSYTGEEVLQERIDLNARLVFMNHLHQAMAGTGSMCIAAAASIDGSIAHEATRRPLRGTTISIGHPSGVMDVVAQTSPDDSPEGIRFHKLGFSRTARKILDGIVYVPR
ncbi:MAG: PrpF protein [Burkholderiales bacterium]|nr:PrpF protein [Burkholderiales bacterium]